MDSNFYYLKGYIQGVPTTFNHAVISNVGGGLPQPYGKLFSYAGGGLPIYTKDYSKFEYYPYRLKGNSYFSEPVDTITPTTDFTIEGWFCVDSLTRISCLVQTGSNTATRSVLWIGTDGTVNFSALKALTTLQYIVSSPTSTIAINTTYHISVNKSGNIITLYVDGSLVGTTTIVTDIDVNLNNNWFFGLGHPVAGSSQIYYADAYIFEFIAYIGKVVRTTPFSIPTDMHTSNSIFNRITETMVEFPIVYQPILLKTVETVLAYADQIPRIDYLDRMNKKITGYTAVRGIASPYVPVGLFIRPNMRFYRSTKSDANGYFEFENLSGDHEYLALAFSIQTNLGSQPQYNAVAMDYIIPTDM